MDYLIHIDTISMEFVHFVFQVGQNFCKIFFLSMKIVFILEKSVDPDKIPPYAKTHHIHF